MPRRLLILIPLLALLLNACSLISTEEDETAGWSAAKFYSRAKSELSGGNYQGAIKYYEGLQARYPFSSQARQGQLDLAYAYYKYDEPDSCIAAADRFIKLYPSHPRVDYAYYIKGLANFTRTAGFIERFLPTDRSQRDPGAARQSFGDFATLVKRYPNSKYAADSRLRMLSLRNNLALYEVHVANYYMRRKAYLAAANRAQGVVEKFQEAPAVPYALRILTDAYQAMDLPKLSQDSQRILALNYPTHPALTDGDYIPKLKRSGLSRIFNILDRE